MSSTSRASRVVSTASSCRGRKLLCPQCCRSFCCSNKRRSPGTDMLIAAAHALARCTAGAACSEVNCTVFGPSAPTARLSAAEWCKSSSIRPFERFARSTLHSADAKRQNACEIMNSNAQQPGAVHWRLAWRQALDIANVRMGSAASNLHPAACPDAPVIVQLQRSLGSLRAEAVRVLPNRK